MFNVEILKDGRWVVYRRRKAEHMARRHVESLVVTYHHERANVRMVPA